MKRALIALAASAALLCAVPSIANARDGDDRSYRGGSDGGYGRSNDGGSYRGRGDREGGGGNYNQLNRNVQQLYVALQRSANDGSYSGKQSRYYYREIQALETQLNYLFSNDGRIDQQESRYLEAKIEDLDDRMRVTRRGQDYDYGRGGDYGGRYGRGG